MAIGRIPISIPTNVEVRREEECLTVKGPLGELTRTIPKEILVEIEDGKIKVKGSNEKRDKALIGLMRSLIQNMVTGVTIGFHKLLEINGVGYKAMMEKGKLRLQLGYSHPVDLTPPEGVKIELVDPTHIKVFGIDKEVVGNVAAKIRAIRRADPYKSKGIKYVGERIRRKAGKKGV